MAKGSVAPLPCCLCGSPARVSRRSGVTGTACKSRYYREAVACTGCGVTTKEVKVPGVAVERWNTRISRIAALEAENERLRKERDEMAVWIKDCTTTISDAIGGGSEMFIRKGEAYRIDPRFVASYIETRRGDLHEARVTIVKLRKEAKP